MLEEISYHIVDFKVQDENLILLELGNALYGSNLSERNQTFNNTKAMLKHAAHLGTLNQTNPVSRSLKHSKTNMDYDYEMPSFLKKIKSPESPVIFLIDDASFTSDPLHEYIQELHDELKEKGATTKVVFDGTIDSFYLCDRNKRIFRELLLLNGLQDFLPETWYFDPEIENTFEPPADIPFFIIKPMNESLGKGVMLVPSENIQALLQALKTNSRFSASVGDIDHYYGKKDKKVLIQRFYPGNAIQYLGKTYCPTGRAVFAVVKKEDSLAVDILDIFWKLPLTPLLNNIPAKDSSVSYAGRDSKIKSKISLEASTYNKIKLALKEKLTTMSVAIYRFDIKSYLSKLYETEKINEINYYLDNYSHVRVQRLDEELINLILSVDKERANTFLVQQSKRFAFPWHLKFINACLKKWVMNNLTELSHGLLSDLLTFFKEQKNVLEDSPWNDKEEKIEEYTIFIEKIESILSQKPKPDNFNYQFNNNDVFFKNKAVETADTIVDELGFDYF